jgi:hypothetical protein
MPQGRWWYVKRTAAIVGKLDKVKVIEATSRRRAIVPRFASLEPLNATVANRPLTLTPLDRVPAGNGDRAPAPRAAGRGPETSAATAPVAVLSGCAGGVGTRAPNIAGK